MKRLFCLIALMLTLASPAFGETKAGMQKKLSKVQKEIADLDKQISCSAHPHT